MEVKEFIIEALKEDMPTGDITTDNVIPKNEMSKGHFIAKEDGILSGIEIAMMVFEIVGGKFFYELYKKSGDKVKKGDIIADINGETATLLKGERVALNILQYMSGIATATNTYAKEMSNGVTLLDTRKTTPNMRYFAKKAVLDGGGTNHRYSLSDMVMLKDNHIKAMGSISKAVEKIKPLVNVKIEVEVETLEQFKEALNTECDIIMLDNMNNELMAQCVKLNNKKKKLEASGNMTIERIKSVCATGVDYISVGALTHSFKALDISLKF